MKIYHFNIKNTDSKQIDEWFELMSDERKQAVSRMQVEHKRNLRIAADALCRKAISEFCGISPADIVFVYNEKGKPYAKGLPVHFNISHSGDIAVCAVSESEIGIDIEKIRSVNPRISDKFATEEENEYISTSENGFFEIWTLKEAYFKCIGTGLDANIKNVSFEIFENKINCSESGYEFSFHKIDSEYICSTCKKTAH